MTLRAARHDALRDGLRQGLARFGLPPYATPGQRAEAVSVLRLPGPISSPLCRAVRTAGVILPPSTTPGCAEETLRMGHLGNVTVDDMDRTVDAISSGLRT